MSGAPNPASSPQEILVEEAYKHYNRYVRGWARIRIIDNGIAEDIVQDAFVLVFRKLDELMEFAGLFDGLDVNPNHKGFRGWLYRVVENLARQARRKLHHDCCLDPSKDHADQATGPSMLAESKELSQRIRNAVSGLPEAEREVILLKYFYDAELSYYDIAKERGITVEQVRRLLHSAKKRLEKRLSFAETAQQRIGESFNV